jgi:AcrR family transcriptional regulator
LSENIRKRGRPRRETTDISILKATRALIMESGVNNFSMDTVAARAGISKPTIYLRWKNKEELISDAFGIASDQTKVPDTGNALMDLRIMLENMLKAIHQSFESPVESSHKMVAGMLESPQLLAQYKQNFIAPRRQAFAKILQKGKKRGEIREDVDEDILIDLISGSYFYCMLFKPDTGKPEDWLQRAFLLIENGITPMR